VAEDTTDHRHHGNGHDHSSQNSQSAAHRDNNMRAAIIHVLADAAVSVLVIVGLLLGRFLGWTWMDYPAVGLSGAVVIAAWSYGLVRDTGAILLDMNPDLGMADRMRAMIEADGDRITDLHLWRLGPGHLGAILSIATQKRRGPEYYQSLLSRFRRPAASKPTASGASVWWLFVPDLPSERNPLPRFGGALYSRVVT
jgi:cation diffusion facilitator family transporter